MTNKSIPFSSLSPDNASGMDRDWTGIASAFPRKLFALLFCFLFIGVGNLWGAEGDANYTLSFTQLSSGTNYNSYASAHTVTVSSKGWSLIGNQSLGAYLCIGGKNTTATDRTSYSTSGIGSTVIGKVRITTGGTGGTGTMTFSKLVLEVSSKSDFSDIIDTKTNNSPSINGNNDFTPTSPLTSWPAGSYYRIKFTVKNSQSKSNGYFKVSSVIFYEGASGTVAVTGVSVSPTTKSIVPGETFTITPTVAPAGATNKSVSWTSSATSYATVSSGTVTGVAAGSSTITCTTADGGYTATCAVTVRGVTLQARDEDGYTIGAGGPGNPTRSGASISPAADAGNYVFKQWQITNASLGSSATTKSNTITNPTGAVTVTAVYYKPITITYKANNQDFTTQTYAYNGTLSFPASNPNGATYGCTGKTFVGWVAEANKDYSHASTAPTYATAGGSVTTAATYYAVFADQEVGDPVETKTQTLQYDTWTYSGTTANKTSYRLFGDGAYVESAAFDLSRLSKVTISGGTFGGASYNGISIKDADGNVWETGTVSTSGGIGTDNFTGGTSLTGTKALRIYSTSGNGSGTGVRLSQIDIYTMEPTVTSSNYATTCCTELGSINGSFFGTGLFVPLSPGKYRAEEL